MLKLFILQIVSILLFINCSISKIQTCDELIFNQYIYDILHNFKTVNEKKYSLMSGMKIFSDKKGNIFKFEVSFGGKDVVLTDDEYNYILKKLNKKNFICYYKICYSEEDFKNEKYLVVWIPSTLWEKRKR